MNEEIQFIECDKESEIFIKNEEEKKTYEYDENFLVFFVATLVHSIIYAICVYKNPSGLAYGAFAVSAMIYILFCLKKMELRIKKGSIFYIVAIIILGVATFCTDDSSIIFMNKVGIFCLTVIFVMDNMFNTEKWQFGKYFSSLIATMIMSVSEIGEYFENVYEYFMNKRNKINTKYYYGLLGCIIAVPVVGVMIILLSSADAVFKEWTARVVNNINIKDIIGITFFFTLMFVASYCTMSYLGKKELDDKVEDTKRWEPMMVIPVITILTVVYIIFSGIQIAYLFVGEFNLPEGYTYAEYAREGFFQLLAVSIINLVIVLACVGYTKTSKAVKVILTVMSLCTFIMIASSAVRMVTYIQFYYLTFLRIFVLWSLLVLFFVFAGVIIYIFKNTFPIFRYVVIVTTCLYICLSFSRPDYFIAKVNLSSTDGNESAFFLGDSFDDYKFLLELSADAAPVVAEWMENQGYEYEIGNVYINEEYLFFYNPDEFGENYMSKIIEKTRGVGIREFNVSRYVAKMIIKH